MGVRRNSKKEETIVFVGASPKGRVLLPEARDFIVFFPVFERSGDCACKLIRHFVGLWIDTHTRTPALLPVASRRVLKASEKSLTPSTISLSVTSFIEMPALARSAMVFAAPSTFSVKLGRSLP